MIIVTGSQLILSLFDISDQSPENLFFDSDSSDKSLSNEKSMTYKRVGK